MSLLDATLREQAAAVAGGDADPAELLDAALSRIEDRNPSVNAIVETFPEQSRQMLAEAPSGPLHGVPVAIKDEWPLPWRAERLGAAEYVGPAPRPGESGPYRALRDAGAVIVGVANMHEYGAGSTGHISAYGPARNPWDTDRCPGGSSSGPGAAVAARLVSGAVGADGVGSIRYPAAYCGLTGLKPTFGRVGDGGAPRPPDDDDRLRAAVPRRRRLPAAGRRLVRRGAVRRETPTDCGSASFQGSSGMTATPRSSRPAARRWRRFARRRAAPSPRSISTGAHTS